MSYGDERAPQDTEADSFCQIPGGGRNDARLEIATKVCIGKLEAPDLPGDRGRRIGASILPISLAYALLAGSMRWAHRDPFDRLLVAEATVENATLVTVDPALTGLPAPATLTW
jgi:PIN domain nuclease of toxin-antitoxin system